MSISDPQVLTSLAAEPTFIVLVNKFTLFIAISKYKRVLFQRNNASLLLIIIYIYSLFVSVFYTRTVFHTRTVYDKTTFTNSYVKTVIIRNYF